ncbi:MAG: class I SAM-dependent methyltransferase [Candidatus Riflebacteria bacterium]|nr:class I SAM-dependent methyltransferase [Candidatus Riflebacteria bacterium]
MTGIHDRAGWDTPSGLPAVRRAILAEKPFLRRVLAGWYREIARCLGGPLPGPVLELGSGPGFLAEAVPGIIRSELSWQPGLDLVADGCRLPVRSGRLGGLVLINVLHHLPAPREFFGEAVRCLAPGGRLVMIEPWGGWWASLLYRALHTEGFDPARPLWEGNRGDPVTGGNNALAWILFQRDRERFAAGVPELEAVECQPFQPFLYLASGGIGSRFTLPEAVFRPLQLLERLLRPWAGGLGMFVLLHLRRRSREG